MEYKLDPRDGEHKLPDVNPRTWGYHSVGPAAGVDFPYLLFCDQLGYEIPRAHGRPGVRWVRLVTDVPNAVVDMWVRRLRPCDYLLSLRGVDTEAVVSVRDPLPGMYELVLLPYLFFKRGCEPTMFEATHPFLFFDYFRVPYRLAPPQQAWSDPQGNPIDRFIGRLWAASLADGTGPTLSWLRVDGSDEVPKSVAVAGRYALNGNPVFGHVVPDSVVRRWLDDAGGWRPVDSISDMAGRPVASVWQAADGSVFLPFDPGEVMRRFWSETYQTIGQATTAARVRSALVKVYYTVRPVMPRPLQIALRRVFTRVQRASTFPRWPVEDALHDFFEWLFDRVARFVGRPVPWLDLWPDGRASALVLTHDVETAVGCRDLELLRNVERELGYASSWNFVPLRYSVADDVLDALRAEGCEIGVHGLLHDGRDLGSWRLLRKRLPKMREYARRWGAVGFRAPATQRVWQWMPKLGFDYDTSYHDTAPYEPTPGGCCSYLPYFNEDMVELPITLPQDHTIFAILQHRDGSVWTQKAAHVRSRRGMVLVLTHPDYADDPRLVDGYRRLLEGLKYDPSVWRALPREVSAWWRRRAHSTLEQTQKGWTIRGPATPDGGIRFARTGESALAAADDDHLQWAGGEA